MMGMKLVQQLIEILVKLGLMGLGIRIMPGMLRVMLFLELLGRIRLKLVLMQLILVLLRELLKLVLLMNMLTLSSSLLLVVLLMLEIQLEIMLGLGILMPVKVLIQFSILMLRELTSATTNL